MAFPIKIKSVSGLRHYRLFEELAALQDSRGPNATIAMEDAKAFGYKEAIEDFRDLWRNDMLEIVRGRKGNEPMRYEVTGLGREVLDKGPQVIETNKDADKHPAEPEWWLALQKREQHA